jgi:hypothetical protein
VLVAELRVEIGQRTRGCKQQAARVSQGARAADPEPSGRKPLADTFYHEAPALTRSLCLQWMSASSRMHVPRVVGPWRAARSRRGRRVVRAPCHPVHDGRQGRLASGRITVAENAVDRGVVGLMP